MHIRRLAIATFTAFVALQTAARAQEARQAETLPTTRPAFGGGGGRGLPEFGPRADPLQQVKPKIAASDEEWKVIGPLLRKVVNARRELQTSIDFDAEAGATATGSGSGDGAGGPPGGFDRMRGGPGFGRSSFDGPGAGPGGPGGPRGPGGPDGSGRGGRFPFGGPPADGFPGDFPPGGFPRGRFGSDERGPGDGLATQPTTRPARANAGDGGPPGGFPPFGGGGPPVGGAGGGAVAAALRELHTAVADPKTSADSLKEKVAAVRKARGKAAAELKAAQDELLELLTSDQEAVLVSLAYLD